MEDEEVEEGEGEVEGEERKRREKEREGGGGGKHLNTAKMHEHARCHQPQVVRLFLVLYNNTDIKGWLDRVEEGKSMTKRKKDKEEGTDREAERKTDRQIKCNGHKTPKLPESWV